MSVEEITAWIDDGINKIEGDERYHYRPKATIFENAPLAMVQLEMETKMKLLKEFKQKIEEAS